MTKIERRPIHVLLVAGTRPEMIKIAPVFSALKASDDKFKVSLCVTAQHREMLDQVLHVFGIKPDYDLNVMMANQSLSSVTARILEQLPAIFNHVKPDWVLVQGDTTTVFSAALTAFHNNIKVGHIEAGLRSFDLYNPFPEEANRRLTSVITNLHFAPTLTAKDALLREGINSKNIVVTGNTVIDALLDVAAQTYAPSDTRLIPLFQSLKKIIFISAHRRESFGSPMRDIFLAMRDLAQQFTNDVEIVCPVHLNPNVHKPAQEILGNIPNVHLFEPFDYKTLVHVINRSYFVITDSGGIQEEAPSLGKPVLVLRDVTERYEGVEANTAKLVGTSRQKIFDEATRLLTCSEDYDAMARAVNPYGDGKASLRIVDALLDWER